MDYEVWNWCYPVIGLGNGDWYLSDGFDAIKRREHRSNFPDDWNVWVFNEAGWDGPSWVIKDVTVERVDAVTMRVTENNTGDHVINFVLDTTPPEERQYCG